VNFLRRNWKAILLAVATSIISLTGDRAVSHRISKTVVEVLPLIPSDLGEPAAQPAPPSPADFAKPNP
jgi:hypothetical protein